jgi:DNA-binding response OmpR family regulator
LSKILLVDDDVLLGETLQELFLARDLNLEIAHTAEDGLQLLNAFEYELILLDWNLPGMSGVALCEQYRKNGGLSHIIFLTSESDVSKKEEALDAGGDDYLVKPFDERELFARIRSVMRRSLNSFSEEIKIGELHFKIDSRVIACNNKTVQLTPKESQLLQFLLRHRDRPYTGQRLFDAIWPSDADVSAQTVKVLINNLRDKLSKVGQRDLIKTVVGSGYVIENRD